MSCVLVATVSSAQESKSLKLLKKGNNHFNKGRFDKAHKIYGRALQADSNNLEASLYYGIGLLESNEKWKALSYIKKAYLNDPKINDQIELYMGMAYQYQGDYGKSLNHLNKARSTFRNYNRDEKIEIDLRITQCKKALELKQGSPVYLVNNLGPAVNSSFSEFAPVVDPKQEKLIFSSDRIEKRKKSDRFTDIYSADKEDEEVKSAGKITSGLNTKYDDMIMAISDDGKQVFLYSYKNNGDIYTSSITDGKWSKPVTIGENVNTADFFEGSACLSKDGTVLFFTSDRPGGFGGLDIYMSQLQENGKWGKPKNLGPKVNTGMNEESPSVSPEGKVLFFSTEGHEGIGGFDVFYTLQEENSKNWSTPVNMGLSVNTPEDDINFMVSNNGDYAYFSTTRPDTYGAEDIYKVILNPENSSGETLIASLYPEKTAREKTTDKKEVLTSQTQTARISDFKDKLLRNVYFEIDQADLSEDALKQLKTIAKYMKSNKDLKLELAGHTDDTGSHAYNLQLSEKRAEAVYTYLVSNGISPDRLALRAFGNKMPFATNDDEKEGRELNRRVEFNLVQDLMPKEFSLELLYTLGKK